MIDINRYYEETAISFDCRLCRLYGKLPEKECENKMWFLCDLYEIVLRSPDEDDLY